MAEEMQRVENKGADHDQATVKVEDGAHVEATDRRLFDFMGKKDEGKKPQEEAICTEFGEKVQVSEPGYKEEVKKHGSLLEKLHRSDSSSSSSSDEEVEEGGEKKKKKKEKKKKEGDKHEEDTSVPVEKYDEAAVHEGHEAEEKKGFLDKIKEKLPGHKKNEDQVAPPPPPPAECAPTHDGEAKEKKGFLDKIKEKLPGYHPKGEEEKEREKEKETASSC